MIVSDDAPVSPLKSQGPDIPRDQQQPPPPSYGAVVNQAQGQHTRPHLQIRPSNSSAAGSSYHHLIAPSPHYPQLDQQQRRRAKKRFCGALCSAVLIYILMAMFFGSLFDRSFTSRRDEVSHPTLRSVTRCDVLNTHADILAVRKHSQPTPRRYHCREL